MEGDSKDVEMEEELPSAETADEGVRMEGDEGEVAAPRFVDDDLLDDSTPAFINPDDAVEVVVDDENIPMDDEDDEADHEGGVAVEDERGTTSEAVDMSRVTLESHTGPVYAVACHRSGSGELYILSGGGDDKAFLHRVGLGEGSSSKTVALSHAHSDSVSCVALNLDFVSDDTQKTPRYAAVGSFDGSIVLYDPDTAQELQVLEGPSDVEWLCFHPKGGSVLLAGSSTDATVWMYHLPLKRCLQVFVGHESSVTCGAFTPDGRWALSGSSDGTVRIWAPRTGACRHAFRLGGGGDSGGGGVTCLAAGGGSDGQLVLVGTEDGQAHVCHTGTLKVVASLRHFEYPTGGAAYNDDEDADLPASVEAVGFSPSNPHWCATGGADGRVKIWDLNTAQCRQVCRVDEDADEGTAPAGTTPGGITRLQWHPTLPVVFAALADGSVGMWDARAGRLLRRLTGHTDVVNDLALCALASRAAPGPVAIVTGGDDQRVRMFEVDAARLLLVGDPQ